MVLLIGGASCVGKTLMAQKLMEKYNIPYLSLDHLKMGIYRSNINCRFTPESPDEIITQNLWPIIREMIKTNIENNQNIIIEGCYFPDSINDIGIDYMEKILMFYIIFSEEYILKNINTKIFENCSIIEKRDRDGVLKYINENIERYKMDHKNRKEICLNNGIKYFEILENYEKEIKNAYKWVEYILKNKDQKERGHIT